MTAATMSVLVVDDEQLARDELCFLLGRAEGIQIAGQSADGVEALRMAGELKPDVVFLDVQMPGLTGFEVAQRLMLTGAPPQLVFVTAYDQHAVDAFAVNAVDYVLKPVDEARLGQTLDRVRARLAARPSATAPCPSPPTISSASSRRCRRARACGASNWPSVSASGSSSCSRMRSCMPR